MPNLPIVAVAGGTGSLGRAIVESLVASHRYNVFVLARKVSPPMSFDGLTIE